MNQNCQMKYASKFIDTELAALIFHFSKQTYPSFAEFDFIISKFFSPEV
jgi:hypothetical protein